LICCNSPSNENSVSPKAKEIEFSIDLKVIEDYMKGADAKYIKSELLKKDYYYRDAGQVYLDDTLQYYIVDMQERIIVSRNYTHFEQLVKADTNHFPYFAAQFHSLYLDKPNQLLIESNNTNKDSLNGMYFTKNDFAYIIQPRRLTIYKTDSDRYVEFADVIKENESKVILLNRALELDKDNEEAKIMRDSLLSR
jgi:hypothetical protein